MKIFDRIPKGNSDYWHTVTALTSSGRVIEFVNRTFKEALQIVAGLRGGDYTKIKRRRQRKGPVTDRRGCL